MRTNYNLRKYSIFFFLLFSCLLSHGQEKSILYNEIKHHEELGDFTKNSITLFTDFKIGSYQNVPTKEMIIEKSTIQNIMSKGSKFISIELPILGNKQSVLHLKKRTLLDDDVIIIIQNENSKQESIEKSNCLAYSGLIAGEESNSLVSIVLYNDIVIGTILIGDKTFSLNQINNTSSYRLYENKADINQPQFACGVSDDNNNSLKNAIVERTQQTTIPKCVKLHFEITKTLNDQFGGVNQSITEFLTLFNLVQTNFANEGITVRVSYLKIWNTDDPYFQSWFGTPGAPGSFQDLGFDSFIDLGGNIEGNIGILLGTFIGGIGGVSGGSPCPNQGYNANRINPNSINQNASTIMHEIGHNLGSHHTHWCGWVGGALDNCYTTEGGCQPGPSPINGGTIMSYCGGSSSINNGFGTQPNAVIVNTTANESCITSCNSDITCEDNIVNAANVSNTTATSFTVGWTSSYPVKVYLKEASALSFTLLNTVPLPNNSYIINYVPTANCTIQKFEIKLVAVCPNGDSKPTVIVYSPQGHLKPYAYILDNYLCNIPNPTVNNLVATGQNLKWYTTETGGTPISTSFIIPLSTYLFYYVSQTVNGCESERTKASIYIQNIATPSGESTQQFNCSSPKINDLVINGTNVLWWTLPTGGLSPNTSTALQNNTYYYAESRSADGRCVSQRFPVLVQINATGAAPYTIPFTEIFDSGLCNLGYLNSSGNNSSGGTFNILSDPNALIFTKGITINTTETLKISLRAKKSFYNTLSTPLIIKIGTQQNVATQTLLSEIIPSSNSTFQQYDFYFTPSNTGVYYISFSYNPSQYNIGFVIDDLSVTSTRISIVGQNIGTPWETDIDLSTNDGVNYFKSNYTIPTGELKFRQDHAWTTNWGGLTSTGTFPSANGVQDGWNIPAIGGTYNITINKSTGAYNFSTSLGMNENNLSKLLIYPNPTNSIINIEIQNAEINSLFVFDILGRLIKTQKANGSKSQINIQELPNAIYLLEVKTDRGNKTVKIVKQ